MMAVHQMQSLGAKQDILRDVVIKYIDHFYPEWVYLSNRRIIQSGTLQKKFLISFYKV